MKFKLTENTTLHYGATLYQIEAVSSFSNVKAGDRGGYVERAATLLHTHALYRAGG